MPASEKLEHCGLLRCWLNEGALRGMPRTRFPGDLGTYRRQ